MQVWRKGCWELQSGRVTSGEGTPIGRGGRKGGLVSDSWRLRPSCPGGRAALGLPSGQGDEAVTGLSSSFARGKHRRRRRGPEEQPCLFPARLPRETAGKGLEAARLPKGSAEGDPAKGARLEGEAGMRKRAEGSSGQAEDPGNATESRREERNMNARNVENPLKQMEFLKTI